VTASYRLERQGLSGSSNETVSYRAATRQLTITRDGRSENRTQTLFDYLDESLRAHRSARGGYVGYFGYELRADCGSAVTHASPFPDAMLMRIEDKPGPAVGPLRVTGNTSLPRPRLSRPEYLDRIRKCIEYIRDGEAYELCLTNQLEFETDIPALRYYETLRRLNPAPIRPICDLAISKSRVLRPNASFVLTAMAVWNRDRSKARCLAAVRPKNSLQVRIFVPRIS
jgi:anthranilate/para-aminobenzoate synthase component I